MWGNLQYYRCKDALGLIKLGKEAKGLRYKARS